MKIQNETIKKILVNSIALILAITGREFSKKHRHNEDWIYRNLNTVVMNIKASAIRKAFAQFKSAMS